MFWEEKEFSKEIILSTQYQEDVYSNVLPQYLWPIMSGGWHQFCPYNNLVKVYECIDGKTIDESPLYDKNNPYENRDPRLDYTIFISDRTKFKGQIFISRPGSGSVDDFTKYNYNGYSIKKFCDENYNGNLMNSGCNWTLIRYAEVLLSYLESMLESGAAIDQALLNSTINKVRGRQAVQMPPVTITDQNKLREIVRRERRVEFAFEGLRYYDILRWGIAADELNGTFTGMKLTNDPANYTSYKVDDEGYYIFETKKFKKGTHELWPIPLSEMQINKNLVQNAGY
ncbi:SusD-like starch-binding protein associating with outer membrane [Dysgonomonas alginatilytica]|uniref:SusD-like starch-binding protein associating with outer membrane n=1 Tax=Dysgonomonas alginatilytica TaxID=1605892 RepID=A0A2V3PJ15_9BACT|nr:RagB/SusD family nutrient uptake outer membrane protein [Dysgonomonas alginatilytica]PXV55995.1 SusD-like starch-binding protein associating with outer membrane [Dysgonomonas alginatilytica]